MSQQDDLPKLSAPAEQDQTPGRYVELDGACVWCIERGHGDPVVLLHGGLTDSRDFDGNLSALSSRYRTYLPERRGHGHTPDVEGPISVETMAGDAITFLECVVGGPARLVGYSAGAMVALQVAVDRPDLVDRLVLISCAFHPRGMLLTPAADGTIPPALQHAYAEVSPDGPDHFPIVVAKAARASKNWPGLRPAELSAVRCPSLIVSADDDIVALEHTIELYRALSDAALAIVPNASHLLLHEYPRELTALVERFLAGRLASPLMPFLRSEVATPAEA